jgi:glyoxylase-like metal-dependent hydrolase (beta-lactamase superfamily II)
MAKMIDAGEARLITMVVGQLEVNCYMLWDPGSMKAFIIDPGGDAGLIQEEIEAKGLKAEYIINTHGHFDHVGAARKIKDLTGARLALHPNDTALMAEAQERARVWGIETEDQPKPDVLLEDGSTLSAGAVTLEVLHTPGHTPGGVCLYLKDPGIIFTGDTLFSGSIGRTDLDGGSYDEIIKSIKTRLLPLGDDVRVLPGHGPATTMGIEKAINPFVTNLIL